MHDLKTVILSINGASDYGAQHWHLAGVVFAAGIENFGLQFLAFVLFPCFAKGGVNERLELATVFVGLEPVFNNSRPCREWAVCRPDVE